MSALPSVSSQISGPVVADVNRGVGGIVELAEDVAVGGIGEDLIGLGDSALHAVGAGGEHDFRAEGAQQNAALGAHGLGHGEDKPVAFDGGDEGEGDAGIAAGGFNKDGFARGDFASPLGVFDHGIADAVFHAGEGILAFEFGHDGCGESGGYAVEPHEGSFSD